MKKTYELFGYRIKVFWLGVIIGLLILAFSVFLCIQGYEAACIAGIVAGLFIISESIEIEKISDLEGDIGEYPDVDLQNINQCFTARKNNDHEKIQRYCN